MTMGRMAQARAARQADPGAPSRGLQKDTTQRGTRLGVDYGRWTVEELRAFAAQLQLPNANTKSRSELLELFVVSTDDLAADGLEPAPPARSASGAG
jgi:hypothetical protein